MGWDYMSKPKSVKKYLESVFTYSNDKETYSVLKSKTIGKVMYMCVKGCISNKNPVNNNDNITCYVILLDIKKERFGYKIMHESEGPCYYECPDEILDMLSVLENNEYNEFAINWRKKCREVNNMKKILKVVYSGDVIKFNHTISFKNKGNSFESDTFKCVGKDLYLPYTVNKSCVVKFTKNYLIKCIGQFSIKSGYKLYDDLFK